MKHTPGPWTEPRVYTDSKGQEYACRIYAKGKGRTVCDVTIEPERDFEANARLISAAPDLLDALEDLRKELREHIRFDVKKHYSLMVADAAAGTAINKARGEAS